ncbi:MAG TPA: 3-phosphoshikimate 1-carboxyvinyltransferase [Candidatus Eisenbacteria bacterium]|jgi:3-phosphoshikimate 1-carboxyvinyltransferase
MRLTVHPGAPLSGEVRPPGDKSITHRAYLLGLIASGETMVENPNPGADCAATLACAAALGAGCEADAARVTIRGAAGALAEPDGVLDCGNSGTTLRLLAGVLAARPFLSVLAGDESLHRRPVARVIEPLRRMGAWLAARDGDRLPPLVIRGGKLSGIRYDLPVASAQVASSVLLAALEAEGETEITLPGPARDHTERMLPAFGVAVESTARNGSGPRLRLRGPARPRGARVRVPGDFSAAAFFLAAAAATPGARVTALGVSLNPTRTALLDALERMGARIERRALPDSAGEPLGDVTVQGPERLLALDLPPEWVPRMIDEVPAWAVAAAAASGRSRLSGASELRHKESDRLALLAANLSALGLAVREQADGLEIEGGRVAGGTVRAGGDHRLAMAFAVLGTRARGPITIDDAASIATSFPGFVATLEALGGEVEPLARAGSAP